MKFTGFTLQINDPKNTLPFYQDILGFELLRKDKKGNQTIFYLKNAAHQYLLELLHDSNSRITNYEQDAHDNYWKYSLFVDDIQRVFNQFNQIEHTTGEAYQFGDIGYLMHTVDKENHQIEFIQKTFKQNTKSVPDDHNYFLKEFPVLGLLTIRTKDPLKSIRFFESILDLKLQVRMYVSRGRGFTLYFLGNKNLQPPNPDIDAIENREWMYQQNHLFVEIQHYWATEYDDDFSLNTTSGCGLVSINFSGDCDALEKKLNDHNIDFEQKDESIIFKTIDHQKIIVHKTRT